MRGRARSTRWALPFLAVLVMGCGDDGERRKTGEGGVEVILRDAGHTSTGSVSGEPSGDGGFLGGSVRGVVADVMGDRIALAHVVVGEHATQSDEQGEFVLSDLPLGEQMVIATLRGYSTGSVPLQLSAEAQSHVKLVLQPAEQIQLSDPTAGGRVVTDAGAVLEFPPRAIVDEWEEPVSLPVEVAVALIDDRDEMAAAPGGMLAQGPGGGSQERLQLESFGMLDVTLRARGEIVHLRDGSEVELSFPMVAHHPWTEGDALDTWFFDAAQNVWKLAARGVVGPENRFETRVGHLSYWSAGIIQSDACVLGRVVTASGEAIAAVDLTAKGRSYLGSSHASSDDHGRFCLEARTASVIELSALARLNNAEHVVAVRIDMPGGSGSCAQPDDCFALGDDLVAVESLVPLCVAGECPQDPNRQACCRSDLGPCGYVVAGDCGGNEDGTWDEPTATPGVESIAGIPEPRPQDPFDAGLGADIGAVIDAGMDAAVDAGAAAIGDAGSAPSDGGAITSADTCSRAIALQPGSYELTELQPDAGGEGSELVFSIALRADRVLRIAGSAGFDGSVALLDPSRCDVLAYTRSTLVAGVPFEILLGGPGLARNGETELAPVLVRFAGEGASPSTLDIDAISLLHAECGDGVLNPASREACDDGDLDAGGAGGCSESGEGCDDGNSAPGDGCSDVCAVESGYVCDGQPSACLE
jgi:cysteine-rich repeat protein